MLRLHRSENGSLLVVFLTEAPQIFQNSVKLVLYAQKKNSPTCGKHCQKNVQSHLNIEEKRFNMFVEKESKTLEKKLLASEIEKHKILPVILIYLSTSMMPLQDRNWHS